MVYDCSINGYICNCSVNGCICNYRLAVVHVVTPGLVVVLNPSNQDFFSLLWAPNS